MNWSRLAGSANTASTAPSMAAWYCSTPAPRSRRSRRRRPQSSRSSCRRRAGGYRPRRPACRAHGVAELRSRQTAQHPGRGLERRRVRARRRSVAADRSVAPAADRGLPQRPPSGVTQRARARGRERERANGGDFSRETELVPRAASFILLSDNARGTTRGDPTSRDHASEQVLSSRSPSRLGVVEPGAPDTGPGLCDWPTARPRRGTEHSPPQHRLRPPPKLPIRPPRRTPKKNSSEQHLGLHDSHQSSKACRGLW